MRRPLTCLFTSSMLALLALPAWPATGAPAAAKPREHHATTPVPRCRIDRAAAGSGSAPPGRAQQVVPHCNGKRPARTTAVPGRTPRPAAPTGARP
ncbi:MAG: hypothetical protein KGI90_01515 [Burkholderiales bacterium]|nr:hypothetical protein [Burkholderiales bacterium]